ncbi:cell wall-binding repeat-containing protein [Clostridium isatidis]|uniref:cell wall-binding repeat-containing protein n=1 Tax=Clostridium isatidis TaxID=182773 RepID=UPI003AAEF7FF
MKKILAIIISIFLMFPGFNVLAETNSEDEYYNFIMNSRTSLGSDNIGEIDREVSSLIKNSKNSKSIINNIVILIRFKGEEEFMTKEKASQLDSAYNTLIDKDNNKFSDLGSISLNSYINDLTYGEVNIKTSFYPKSGDSILSIEAPYSRKYYEGYFAGSSKETEFINWAFNEVKNQINLSADELDRDNDGKIDAVTFLVNGVTTSNNMLWPHEAAFTGNQVLYGKKLGNYNLINVGSNEINIFNKEILEVVIHEFLHIFNYPDLYRYYKSGSPVGEWDIMADSTGYGQLPLVYTRSLFGNLNLNIKDITQDGVYTLKSSQSTNKNDVIAFKINSPLSEKEYFMVEFRKQSGNWDSSLPGSGIIVYRINNIVDPWTGNRNGTPDHIYVFRPNEINLNLGGGYISGAFLSKESGRTSIDNLFFSDGTSSGIKISNVGSANGDTISFKVTFPKKDETQVNVVEKIEMIGEDRYETSALISSKTFKSSETVILVNGAASADGLTVSPVASYLKAPILLVRNDSIPNEIVNEIRRLKATKVIIAGGEEVVSNKVVNQIKSLGISNIKRLGGEDRYETSFEIMKYIDANLYDVNNIIVGNGLAEADMMSVSSFAGRDNMPIVLTKKNDINLNIYNWLKNENINNSYIIGGNEVVSDTLLNKINLITKSDIKNNRLGGIDRYETNSKIIKKFALESTKALYVIKGEELIDGLSAAPISTLNNGAIVLAGMSLTSTQKEAISKLDINKLIQVGGGVSKNTKNDLINLLN